MKGSGILQRFSAGSKQFFKSLTGIYVLENVVERVSSGIAKFAVWANLPKNAEFVMWSIIACMLLFAFGRFAKMFNGKTMGRILTIAVVLGAIVWAQGLEDNIVRNVYAFFRQKIMYVITFSAHDAFANILFWLMVSSIGFSVFFGTFSSFLGLSNETKGVAHLIYWSLPISFLAFFLYTSGKMWQQSQDVLYPLFKNVRSEFHLSLLKQKRNIDHRQLLRNNREYVTNTVRSHYDEFIYADIARAVGKKGIHTKNAAGDDAILLAVKEGNLAAVKAFAPYINPRKEYAYGPFYDRWEAPLTSIASYYGQDEIEDYLYKMYVFKKQHKN